MKPLPSTADRIDTALDATQTIGDEGKLSLGLLVRLFTANSGRPDNDTTGQSVSATQAVFAPVHSVAASTSDLTLPRSSVWKSLNSRRPATPRELGFFFKIVDDVGNS